MAQISRYYSKSTLAYYAHGGRRWFSCYIRDRWPIIAWLSCFDIWEQNGVRKSQKRYGLELGAWSASALSAYFAWALLIATGLDRGCCEWWYYGRIKAWGLTMLCQFQQWNTRVVHRVWLSVQLRLQHDVPAHLGSGAFSSYRNKFMIKACSALCTDVSSSPWVLLWYDNGPDSHYRICITPELYEMGKC